MYKINVYVLCNIELLLFSFMYRAKNCTIINLACTIFYFLRITPKMQVE